MANKLNITFEKAFELAQRLDFFSTMNVPQCTRVLKQLQGDIFVYKKGETIIREGAEDTSLFIILSGLVTVQKGDDELKAVGKVSSGDFFGEISFITGAKRTTSILACEDTIVLHLSQKNFERLDIATQILIKDKVILKLISRLDKMNSRVLQLRNKA